MLDNDDLLTVQQAAEVLGGTHKPVSVATVYRLVRSGRLSPPLHPSPGTSRFVRSKLLDYVRSIAGEAAA
jgi:excisionase family DNA binding protein